MIFDIIKISTSALWANKLRSILTFVGMAIGVASVISIISVLEGMMTKVSDLMNTWGSATIIVTRFGIITSEEEWRKALKRKKITIDDARAIENNCDLVTEITLLSSVYTKIKHGNKSMFNVEVNGFSASAPRVMDVEVSEGRFYSDYDDQHRRSVTVIGKTVQERFFPYESPIGKQITIDGHKLTVVGVGKEYGSLLGQDNDRYCWVPMNTYLKFTGRHQDIGIAAKAKSELHIDEAMDQIRTVLRTRRHVEYHDPDDFALLTSDQVLEFFDSFTSQFRIIAIFIPMISIVVAGIVVMNIMMVSVTERTREIGIRKSVGATRRNVLSQFMFEAIIMSMIGGLFGLAGGLYLASIFASEIGVPFVISMFAVVLGLSIPAAVGIFFGIYPAWKASKLDPIDALRYE